MGHSTVPKELDDVTQWIKQALPAWGPQLWQVAVGRLGVPLFTDISITGVQLIVESEDSTSDS